MYFGAAWYPEQWPESRWPEDIRLMREAGMNLVRIGESAWSALEPTEGQVSFEWLDRAVALLGESGISVLLATPTAAPPAWLTHHHPDTVAMGPDGRPVQHGRRRHYAAGSSTYHKFSRRIVEHLARRFGRDERVVAWQIDDAFGREDYSDSSRRQFQAFLKERHRTLEALNTRWATPFWSQTYTDWSEIPIPRGSDSPCLELAWREFVTHTYAEFQQMQIEAIRATAGEHQKITHNYPAWRFRLDAGLLARGVDFVSESGVSSGAGRGWPDAGAAHDLARGLKGQGFWLIQELDAAARDGESGPLPDRGVARSALWSAAAAGAGAIVLAPLRASPGGQACLGASLLGPDGLPRPFYAEAAGVGAGLAKVASRLANSVPRARVAIIHSFADSGAFPNGLSAVHDMLRWRRPLAAGGVTVDIVPPDSTLDGYALVIASSLASLPAGLTDRLETFVRVGGVLVIGIRTGLMDEYGARLTALPPGPLRDMAGVEAAEGYVLADAATIRATWQGVPEEGACTEWAELLRPTGEDAEPWATYGRANGWLDGEWAAAARPLGEGHVVTVGAVLNDELQRSLAARLCALAGIALRPDIPAGVEVSGREGPGGRVTFVINHGRAVVELPLGLAGLVDGAADLLTGITYSGRMALEPYGVALFEAGDAAG